MEYKIRAEGSDEEVVLRGRFTFTDYESFRGLVADLTRKGARRQVLNLGELDFIDSAGLGMLLIARDEAERNSCSLVLRRPQGQVKRMLEVARFNSMFNIET